MRTEPDCGRSGLLCRMRSARPAFVLGLATVLVAAAGCHSGSGDGQVRAPSPSASPLEHWPSPSPVPSSPAVATTPQDPGFDSRITRLRGALLREVRHKNWHPGCPVPLGDLRVLTVDYH